VLGELRGRDVLDITELPGGADVPARPTQWLGFGKTGWYRFGFVLIAMTMLSQGLFGGLTADELAEELGDLPVRAVIDAFCAFCAWFGKFVFVMYYADFETVPTTPWSESGFHFRNWSPQLAAQAGEAFAFSTGFSGLSWIGFNSSAALIREDFNSSAVADGLMVHAGEPSACPNLVSLATLFSLAALIADGRGYGGINFGFNLFLKERFWELFEDRGARATRLVKMADIRTERRNFVIQYEYPDRPAHLVTQLQSWTEWGVGHGCATIAAAMTCAGYWNFLQLALEAARANRSMFCLWFDYLADGAIVQPKWGALVYVLGLSLLYVRPRFGLIRDKSLAGFNGVILMAGLVMLGLPIVTFISMCKIAFGAVYGNTVRYVATLFRGSVPHTAFEQNKGLPPFNKLSTFGRIVERALLVVSSGIGASPNVFQGILAKQALWLLIMSGIACVLGEADVVDNKLKEWLMKCACLLRADSPTLGQIAYLQALDVREEALKGPDQLRSSLAWLALSEPKPLSQQGVGPGVGSEA
jgi:hypothetical protein